MKKQILILAGSVVILASCGSNNNASNNSAATMDSIAKANAALQADINKRKNDSTIDAIAKARVDSIEKATAHHGEGGHEKHGGNKPDHNPVATQTVTPEPPKQGGLKGHSDQSQNQQGQNPGSKQSGGGMRSHSDQNQGH